MFNPNYALFRNSAQSSVTFQPNRFSYVNPDHLAYFTFVGRVIGKALYDGQLLDAHFTRSFYKHILGHKVNFSDLEALDPDFHSSLRWALENSIEGVLDLDFSTEVDRFGLTEQVDLKPDGRNIPVTDENKHEYVALMTEMRLTTAIRQQIDAFLRGFRELIPADMISIFDAEELELLISGLPDIDILDLRANTLYSGGYTATSPQIKWFWEVVTDFDSADKAKLVQYVTGTSKVPLEGFKSLQGMQGPQKFTITKSFQSTDHLPAAHTCFNSIDLPVYESREQLRERLMFAITETSGFALA